jgi:PAS domain S-box-containing protein
MTVKMNLLNRQDQGLFSKWSSFIHRLSEPACLTSENGQILASNSSFTKLYIPSGEKTIYRISDLFIIPNLDEDQSNPDRNIVNAMSIQQKAMTELDQTTIEENKLQYRLTIVKSNQKDLIPNSVSFHQKVLDHLFQEIVVVDKAFNYVYFSASTLADKKLRDWLIGRSDFDYCNERGLDCSVAEKRFEQYQLAFDSRQVVNWVEHFPLANGEFKKMFRKISPIMDDKGAVEYLLINSFHVTDEHILAHEFELSKNRFDAMVQNSPNSILLFDADNQYCVDANHASLDLFGLNKVELLKCSLEDISFHVQPNVDNHLEYLKKQCALTKNNESVKFNWIIQNNEGGLIPTEVTLIRMPANNRVLIRASFDDISERLLAEQTQKQYQMLFENSQQGILVYNVTTKKVISCNKMACKIYGYTQEEFLDLENGHNSPKQQSNGAFSGNIIKKYTERIFDKGTAQIEVEQLTKDGRTITLAVMGHKLKSHTDDLMVSVFIDRTEHISNPKKLKKQAEQFQQFVRNTPFAVAMLDTEMNYILVSEEWAQEYGKGEKDLIGKNHYDLHPEIPERWKKGHNDALRGIRVKKEKDALIIDGKTEWFRWEVKPWFTYTNEIGGVLIYSESITEQVEAESKIKRQGIQFKSVFENSAIGWLECDVAKTKSYIEKIKAEGVTYIDEQALETDAQDLWPHFKVLSYNKQIGEIFGLEEGAKLNELKILSMMKEDAKVIFLKELEAMLQDQKSFEAEFRIVNLNKEERHLFLSVNYPEDDDYSRVLYSVLDITDLRQSVKALRQSEQRYKSMFEDNRLAVAYTNDENDYYKVNQAFHTMFGYNPQDLANKRQEDFSLPEYAEETKENYDLLRRNQIRSFNMEKAYQAKDGSVVFANLSVTGLYDFMGHYFGNVAIIEDITEKKEIYAKLNEQNKELTVINRELDRFVYSAAHDLRAPLANVKGLANIVKMSNIGDDAEKYLDLQLTSIDKMDGFIDNLVDYLKNSRHELKPQSVDFNAVIPELIEHYRYGEQSRDINFSYHIEQNNNFVTDSRRLEIVLSNLLSNSIRYCDSNKQKQVDIRVKSVSDGIEIKIKDNGIGIAESELKKIFGLFYRANKTSNGTGIGLYLVSETVQKLEGTISVSSKLGEWTEFTVNLISLDKVK